VLRRHWLLLSVFALILVIFLILSLNAFFTERNLFNIARSFAWIAIAAFGESLVIIIGGIDLSVGAVMGLSGLISALGMQAGLPVWLAIASGLLTGGLVGWANGTIVGRVKLPPFIVTLATMSIARGATHGLSSGWSVTDLPEGFRMLGQSDLQIGPISFPLPFIMMLGLAVLVSLLANRTLLGRYIYSTANNEQALLISGVNVAQVKVLTYTFCGLLAATGGLLMTARLGVATPTAATGYELDIISAAVIGGTSLFGGRGSIFGVLLGAAFMQVLRNGLVLLGFPAYWQEAAMGAMILLAILLDYWQHARVMPWSRRSVMAGEKQEKDVSKIPAFGRRGLSIVMIVVVILIASLVVWQVMIHAPGGQSSNQETLTIAWIPKALDNPVFELGHQGAVKKAAEISASGAIQVKVLYVGSVSANVAEQVRLIDDVISRKVDAIAISCNDPTACIDPINKAVAAGIPVMTWDSDSPQSHRFTYLGVDNYLAGQAAAGLLVEAMGQQGDVAILTGVPGALNLEERVRGFMDALIPYPDIEIVATVVSNDDINLGIQVVEETMQAHPDLDGWFFVGMWPLVADRGSMPLWEFAVEYKGLKTVAFDTLPVELELLREGYLSGLVGQKYWGWGYDTIQIIYDYLVNGTEYSSFISSGMDIVTRNNVGAMLEAWETNDFSQPLPEP
jgi:ribose transport system substrate-binding protein